MELQQPQAPSLQEEILREAMHRDWLMTHEPLDVQTIAQQLSLPHGTVLHGTNFGMRGLHRSSATGAVWHELSEVIFTAPHEINGPHHVFGKRVIIGPDGKEHINRQKIAFRLFNRHEKKVWTKLADDERGRLLAKEYGAKLVSGTKAAGAIDSVCREIERVDGLVQIDVRRALGRAIPGYDPETELDGVETLRGVTLGLYPAIADVRDGIPSNFRRAPIEPHIWVEPDMVPRADISPMLFDHWQTALAVLSKFAEIEVVQTRIA